MWECACSSLLAMDASLVRGEFPLPNLVMTLALDCVPGPRKIEVHLYWEGVTGELEDSELPPIL